MPEDETDFGSLITMKLGTLTHQWLENLLMWDRMGFKPELMMGTDWLLKYSEMDLTHLLPEGWTGTCDYLFQHEPTATYAVSDLKTSKPEALAYLNGEPKESHWIQVSCYHAALSAEYVLDPDISICYLPKGKTAKQETVLPVMVSKAAMPKQQIFSRLEEIKMRTDEYVTEYERTNDPLNKFLAPMPAATPRIGWNKATNQWDVTMRPDWTEEFIGARFGEVLCPKTPSQKIGHYTLDLHYIARKGIMQPDEVPMPSMDEIKRRQG